MRNFKQAKGRVRALLIILCLFLSSASIGTIYAEIDSIEAEKNDFSAPVYPQITKDPRIVNANLELDEDSDKIADDLEDIIESAEENVYTSAISKLEASYTDSEKIGVIIDLNKAPNDEIVSRLENLGADIMSVYSHVVFAIAAQVPMENLESIASIGDVTLIEKNDKSSSNLDTGALHVGARNSSYVWNATSPIKGNGTYSIAILDTGIDTSHLDLQNSIYFHDFSNEGYTNGTTGYDYDGHGTHCASIAAGTGSADLNPETVNQTFSGTLPDSVGGFYTHWFEIKDNGANPNTVLNVTWDNSNGGETNLSLVDKSFVLQGSSVQSGNETYENDVGQLSPGWYSVAFEAATTVAKLKNYSVQVRHEYNYPLTAESSGDPIFSGIAPKSNIVGLKVLNDDGAGIESWLLDALDWIAANGSKSEYNITVVSMSLSLESISATTDTAVNNLVDDGFICVAAAGNEGTNNGNNAIFSPASAAKCITVGAVNDAYEISYYSSNGKGIVKKPDVVAPGGTLASENSSAVFNQIVAADSNNGEGHVPNINDVSPNDYIGYQGTSMACPFIAGIAQLAVDKMLRNTGKKWQWSGSDALKIKQLICMGTFEVAGGEWINWDGDDIDQTPSTDRTGRDYVEGFGMARADAVIQALNDTHANQFLNKEFYLDVRNDSHAQDQKVVVYPMDASAGEVYNLTLDVPATGDFDLIIYNGASNATDGTPLVNITSTETGLGTDENITFSPTLTDTYYWSIRAVDGYGIASLSIKTPINLTVTANVSKMIASENFDARLVAILEDPETENPITGKLLDVTTDLGSLNASSATTDANGKIFLKLTGEEIIGSSDTATVTFTGDNPAFTDTFEIDFDANDEPVLSEPSDVVYAVTNTSTTYINWTVSDGNYTAAANYTIRVTGDAADEITGEWGTTLRIDVNVSGYDIGDYYYDLEIEDGYGGTDTDVVLVSVVENPYTIEVTPNATEVVAVDGVDVLLRCHILYLLSSPVTGRTVNVATDLGSLNASSGTSNGEGYFNLTLSAETIATESLTANITFTAAALENLDQDFQIDFVQNEIPILSNPLNIQYAEGSSDPHVITWAISDGTVSPAANYTITVSGATADQTTGGWTRDGSVIVDVSGLTAGVYNYTLVIDDGYGGTDSHSVLVMVDQASAFSWVWLLPIAFVALIAVILFMHRKKKKKNS